MRPQPHRRATAQPLCDAAVAHHRGPVRAEAVRLLRRDGALLGATEAMPRGEGDGGAEEAGRLQAGQVRAGPGEPLHAASRLRGRRVGALQSAGQSGGASTTSRVHRAGARTTRPRAVRIRAGTGRRRAPTSTHASLCGKRWLAKPHDAYDVGRATSTAHQDYSPNHAASEIARDDLRKARKFRTLS